MNRIPWLGPNEAFPNPLLTSDPDRTVPGLFAVSERIYPGQLQAAYQLGLFPWYSDNQPVLWWSPDPRMVLVPTEFKCSDSLKKTLRSFMTLSRKPYAVSLLILQKPFWLTKTFRRCFVPVQLVSEKTKMALGSHMKLLTHIPHYLNKVEPTVLPSWIKMF